MANNQNVQKWIDGLTSGEFSQGFGKLQTEDGFCCLGVACAVYERETGERLKRTVHGTFRVNEDREYALHHKVVEWLGLENTDPWVPQQERDTTIALSTMNDRNTPFSEIAEQIRLYILEG